MRKKTNKEFKVLKKLKLKFFKNIMKNKSFIKKNYYIVYIKPVIQIDIINDRFINIRFIKVIIGFLIGFIIIKIVE